MSKLATTKQEETYYAIKGLSNEIHTLIRNVTENSPQEVCPLYDNNMEKIVILAKAMYVLADDAKRYAD